MKKYRVIIMAIIAMGIILIGTSDPLNSLYKATGLISKGIDNDKDKNREQKVEDKKPTSEKDDENSIKDNSKYLICIDPGHQEKGDPNLEPVGPGSGYQKARVSSGTEGVATKKPEYVLNLEASTVLKHILEGKGYNIIMTRESHDVNISNSERAIFANDKNANLVVRIHADSIDNSSKTGASILIPEEGGRYTSSIYEESNKCAELIRSSMKNSGIQINGVFQRGDLTGFNWSKVPAVLVEMGFMSNYNEDQMMSNPDYQRKLMQSIADGVDEYFKTK
ncbi:N-acetylmuramoyl-L-alanine amidase family protein [Romboutsia sp. 1001713B170207_170306_H8]|uniref:N-acetylmuramoyl-L-alanine amidase family protein n=1 Tax=Romboutsia sp. 1001713B170207_170306_H8 TaxID=2787112 RepID=UPI00082097E8|nr:N-acetylmuramoyl-L-alanine amidase [Romboutsia sp. 1001713B170207_170306_H8]SCI02278.1 N-acetylmuramoyl-L-alanine amidase AmiC precursor [uncultured Clostridium sp.]